MPLLSFKMGRGLHMQLLIWSSNLETLCEHAAASRAGHISSMRRRARSSPGSSLTRPHLLPVLTIRTRHAFAQIRAKLDRSRQSMPNHSQPQHILKGCKRMAGIQYIDNPQTQIPPNTQKLNARLPKFTSCSVP